MAVAAVGMRGVIVRGMRMLMLAPVGMRPGMRVRVGQGVAVAMQITAQALVGELFLRHWVLRLRGRYGVAEVGSLARRQTGRCAHRFRGSCPHLHDADVCAGEPQQQVHPRFWLRLPVVQRLRIPRGWPFGVVEAIWAVIAFRRYDQGRKVSRAASSPRA